MIWIHLTLPHPTSAAQPPTREMLAARWVAWLDTLRTGLSPESSSRVATEPTADTFDLARAGDADAFATLFRAHGDDVLRVCRRMLGNADAASDAQSEVFLKARRALDGYDRERPFRTWLLSIASHHCIDQLRRTATERRVFADGELEPGELAGPEPSPLTRLLAREKRVELDRALESLPLEYRVPLMLRYFSDASYDEIAESLGTTRARVGQLLYRGKRRLREELARPQVVHDAERPVAVQPAGPGDDEEAMS